MTTEVFLHAGAHRTGTTSFQLSLAANLGTLQEAGFDVVSPGVTGVDGDTLRPRLPGPGNPDQQVRTMRARTARNIEQLLHGRPRVLMSEERLPGLMRHFFRGDFFPTARERFAMLRELLPGPVAHLLYVVRPYDALYPSAWRHLAEWKPIVPFDLARHHLLEIDTGWPELIALMIEELRPARTTVIDYADRPDNEGLLHLLAPATRGLPLAEAHARVNASVSDNALLEIQQRLRRGVPLDAATRAVLIERHKGSKQFIRFSDVERQYLRDRYTREIETLRRMPGVDLWSPETAAALQQV